MNEKRNSSIELLRIISMLMITTGHLYSFWMNGFDAKTPVLEDNNFLPYIITRPGVDIFVLISGYFGIHSKIKSAISLYFTSLFYVFFAAVIALLFLDANIIATIKKVIYEASFFHGSLWYIKTYIALMMFAPFINILFTKRRSVQLLYLIIFALADFGYQDFLGGFYEFKYMGGALLHFMVHPKFAVILSQ